MKLLELEMWARQICERVVKSQPVEDSRVELKTTWLDPQKAARRLAGQANAVRSENILWLIGVDEKIGITGANHQEMSKWWPQVKTCFHGETPALIRDLNIEINGKTVAALYFDTSRFPFVIKNPDFGKKAGEFELETPWREGTAVRSATRGDLLLMLAPLIRVPKVELPGGRINIGGGQGTPVMSFQVEAYVVPTDGTQLCFPLHTCQAEILSANVVVADSFSITLESPRANLEQEKLNRNQIRVAPSNELILSVPEKISVKGYNAPATRFGQQDEFQLRVALREAFSETSIVLFGTFTRIKDEHSADQPNRWGLKK